MKSMETFQKTRDFLICVDSDGCAMDTMDSKHIRCFGPCLVAEWGLDQRREEVLTRWNEINLYSMTRGINRFQGLALVLTELSANLPVPGVEVLSAWVEEAEELSEAGLKRAIAREDNICLRKALAWSQAVNRAIGALPEGEKRPFPAVEAGLAAAHTVADVVIVSSANRASVEEEWGGHGLLPHTDLVLTQDAGTKAACIAALLEKGYAPQKVLMVGDAPGDLAAARKNGVWFYPILVRREAESWVELVEGALPQLLSGAYAPYGADREAAFRSNLC